MKRNTLIKAINYALMTQHLEQESLEMVLMPDSSYKTKKITVPEGMVLYPYYTARKN